MLILKQGDCLDLMNLIPDNFIDLVAFDPPFAMTACSWDSLIPLEPMWESLKRITKPNAAIVINSAQPFTSILINSNIKYFKCEWIWRKPQGTNPLCKDYMPLRNHESICVFSYGKPKYFPQMREGKPYKGYRAKEGQTIGESYGKRTSRHRDNPIGERYPVTVVDFPQVRRALHPTQKPLSLCEYFIKTYSAEGDIVLDICTGSGSNGEAAFNLNRHFIGFEKDGKYFDIAEKRLGNLCGYSC